METPFPCSLILHSPLFGGRDCVEKKSFRYESASDLLKKNSIWSPTWLTFFFTETSIADNFPIYIVQASCLSFIFDLKFQKCRFYKYMKFLNHFYPLEFTNTTYFLISKIWRPPSLVHLFCTPLYLAVETALKKKSFRYESASDLLKKILFGLWPDWLTSLRKPLL